MAVVVNITWPGVTLDAYDRVANEVDWVGEPPDGGQYHVAWLGDGALRIVDVWDSAETFEAFSTDRLGPGVAAVGLESEPSVEIWPLQDLQIEGDLTSGAVVNDDMEPGMPLEAYEALETGVDWVETPPAGGISHIAALDGDVVRDIAVWNDHDALATFVESRIMPVLTSIAPDAAAESGDPESLPVHAVFNPTKARLGG